MILDVRCPDAAWEVSGNKTSMLGGGFETPTKQKKIPSGELTCPALGEGKIIFKSTSKGGDMLVFQEGIRKSFKKNLWKAVSQTFGVKVLKNEWNHHLGVDGFPTRTYSFAIFHFGVSPLFWGRWCWKAYPGPLIGPPRPEKMVTAMHLAENRNLALISFNCRYFGNFHLT